MSKTVKIRLDHPVRLPDGQRSEITMRRPTLGDYIDHPIRGVEDLDGESRLIALLCGWNAEDLRLLDWVDYTRLQAQLMSFRNSGPAGSGIAASGDLPLPPDRVGQGELSGADV